MCCAHARPKGVRAALDRARDAGYTVALRGGGRSYGDAAINDGGVVLDLARMNRILAWDPVTGLADVEPGVTIEQLWQNAIADGWWPPVVSGTMFTTMGGCAAMNIHGKNNFHAGTFGQHIREFDILLPSGEVRTCSPVQNDDLYFAAIGGFGMLGCIVRLRIQLKRVHSGLVRVEAFNTPSIGAMIEEFEVRVPDSDYLVGWIDTIRGGGHLGRGTVHRASYLNEGDDPEPALRLAVAAQGLPDKIMGVFPKSRVHLLLRPFCNKYGMRMVNTAKFHSGRLEPRSHVYFQTHAAFAFLLDYVPDWKLAYKPAGLIQYQSFIPREGAVAAFESILRRAQRAGMPPFLGVFKKHRPDPFLLTHSVDGYSLALDFKVPPRDRPRLWALAAELDEIVLDHAGRFYFAKDLTLRPGAPARFLPAQNLEAFARLKHECDPGNLLQTGLSRRLFGADFSVGA